MSFYKKYLEWHEELKRFGYIKEENGVEYFPISKAPAYLRQSLISWLYDKTCPVVSEPACYPEDYYKFLKVAPLW